MALKGNSLDPSVFSIGRSMDSSPHNSRRSYFVERKRPSLDAMLITIFLASCGSTFAQGQDDPSDLGKSGAPQELPDSSSQPAAMQGQNDQMSPSQPGVEVQGSPNQYSQPTSAQGQNNPPTPGQTGVEVQGSPYQDNQAASSPVKAGGSATAKAWRFQPYVELRETLTNNVTLAPSESAKGDLVSELTPGFRVSGTGARASLNGSVAAPILYYARSESNNNKVYPAVNILGNIEAVENFFYVEAGVSSAPQFLSPFGAQPVSLANATDNRYTSTSYSVSPYVKGSVPGSIGYLLRNNNTWTRLTDAPANTADSYMNQWLATVASPVAPFGWGADFSRTNIRFKNQGSQLSQLARARLAYKIVPQIQIGITGGYEDNRYSDADYKGSIYGAEFEWRPTQRSSVTGNWEHRFFGSSYQLAVDHRTPVSVWNVRVSRNTTSYPEQAVAPPAGGSVERLVDEAYSSKVPNPTERQAVVDQFIQDRDLPTVLSTPVNSYTDQVTLENNQSATFGLLAVRNSIFFTVFNSKKVPIQGSGTLLPSGVTSSGNSTQRGGSITWTHRLTPRVNMNATAQTSKTFANDTPSNKTTQSAFVLNLSSPLTAKTSLNGGAHYQVFRSDGTSDYTEAAIFAGVNHQFR